MRAFFDVKTIRHLLAQFLQADTVTVVAMLLFSLLKPRVQMGMVHTVVAAVGKVKQEEYCKSEASMGCTARRCLSKPDRYGEVA